MATRAFGLVVLAGKRASLDTARGIAFALWRHALCEGRKGPFLLGMAGLAIMASALLIEGSPLEPFVTSIGAALLAAAHILNWRGRRSCHEGELRQ